MDKVKGPQVLFKPAKQKSKDFSGNNLHTSPNTKHTEVINIFVYLLYCLCYSILLVFKGKSLVTSPEKVISLEESRLTATQTTGTFPLGEIF